MARDRKAERARLAQSRQSYGKSWRELSPAQRRNVQANLHAKELGYPSARSMRRHRAAGKVSPRDTEWRVKPAQQPGRLVVARVKVVNRGRQLDAGDAHRAVQVIGGYPGHIVTVIARYKDGSFRTVGTWGSTGLVATGLAGVLDAASGGYPGQFGGLDALDFVIEATGQAAA